MLGGGEVKDAPCHWESSKGWPAAGLCRDINSPAVTFLEGSAQLREPRSRLRSERGGQGYIPHVALAS